MCPLLRRLTFLVVAVAWPALANADPVTLAAIADNPPFSYEEAGKVRGIDVAIAREAARRAGMVPEIILLPWKRVLLSVEAGSVTGGMSAFRTPERDGYAYFPSEPLRRAVFRMFVPVDSDFAYDGVASLRGRVIGLELGHAVTAEFDAAKAEGTLFQVEEATSPRANLLKLLSGRTDGYINNEMVVWWKAKSLGFQDKIKTAGAPVTEGRKVYAMFSRAVPGNKARAARFAEALTEMHESSAVEKIFRLALN